MQTHPIRLFEKYHVSTLKTHVINVVEQPVKLVRDGKPAIVNLLGVVLAETIFHPQGGGQPSDKGQLNEFEIVTVRESKDESTQNIPIIYHFLDPQTITLSQLATHQTINMTLDVEFRKQCARSHTAGHLIADVLELDEKFLSFHAKSIQGHHFPGSEYIKVLVTTTPTSLEGPEK